MNIADLWIGVKANLTTFSKELDAGVTKAASHAGTKAGNELDRSLGGRIKQLQGKLGGHTAQIAAGLGLGGPLGLAVGGVTTLIDTLSNAGRAASDFAETSSKLTAVFPTQAEEMRKWGDVADKTMGLSTQAALEAAGTFGNFLQAMGQAEPVAADMSRTMVQLATDLGSFNNANPEEVLLALRSGLSGETEPLRRFGVDISDAAVQTELLASGVEKVGKGYTQAQKIQGRYKLIMRQTITAQNDYARTASGTANATKSQAATVANLEVKFGALVNQVQNTAVQLGGSGALALSNVIDGVAGAFNNIQDAIDNTRTEIREVGSELARLAEQRGLDPAIAEWFAKVSIGAEDAAQAIRLQAESEESATQAAKDNAKINREGYELDKLTAEGNRVLLAGDEEATKANEEAIKVLEAKIAVERAVEETGNETVRGLTHQAEAVRNVNKEMDLLAATVDYAKRAKLTPEAFFSEVVTYMAEHAGTDIEHAIGALGQQINTGTFVPMGETAGGAYVQAFREGTVAELVTLAPEIGNAFGTATNSIRAQATRMKQMLAVDMTGLADVVDVTWERVKNKKGEGFHRIKVVKRQLTTLKQQFKDDLRDINWLLDHPGEGDKTISWTEKKLDKLILKRDKALEEGDWTAFGLIQGEIAQTEADLRRLNGQRAYIEIQMSIMRRVHDSGNGPSGGPGADVIRDRGGSTSLGGRHAKGGYAPPGWSGWVGEGGPERLTMYQGGGGYVRENQSGGYQTAQDRRIDFFVHDPDGGLARAGIGTRQLAAAIASSADAQSRYEDAF